MFHSVGNDNSSWHRNWLSVSLDHFEHFCEFLNNRKYRTLHLNDWYNLTDHSEKVDNNIVTLTFDDGYLDNWAYVYPYMEKFKLKGTIFINPEFVDKGDKIRPNLMDVWAGKIKKNDLVTLGFLNWAEIQLMEKSGIMDIQSHSMSHNFLFSSDKIIDIYTGQSKYDWLAWVLKPDRKPFYMLEDLRDLIPLGYPIFEYGRALGIRRYFPDEKFIDEAIKLFNTSKAQKDINFLIKQLNEKVQNYQGGFETAEEMLARYRYELFESKRILEEKLNKKVEFLCWPGGGYNDLSLKMSVEAGYKASTIASWDKNECPKSSETYKRIRRLGMGSFISKGQEHKPSKFSNHLVYSFKGKKGNLIAKLILKIQKLLN